MSFVPVMPRYEYNNLILMLRMGKLKDEDSEVSHLGMFFCRAD